jgi:hypothetical protein
LQVGAGVYFGGTYALSTATRIYQAPDVFEKGKITGRATADITAGLYGFKTGAKLFDVTRGAWATRGRTFIDIPQGEYPTAPPRQQLSLFKKNVYTELGVKPGAFHTTGDVFWKGGRIIPDVGTSELPGLYGSTQISTPFARIQGSSSTAKFNMGNWFKNLITPTGKPGVAYLQPKGFRYSPAKVGKWYQPAKIGYADVPGIKTEIEAIFRPEAGGYTLTSKGFYTTIKGVRVPIDSFIYDPSIISSTQQGSLNLIGGQGSYLRYVPTSSINIGGVISSVVSPSKISITPSYSSTTISSPVSSSVISSSLVPSTSSIMSSTKPSSSLPSSSKGYSSAMSSIAPSISSIMSSTKPSSKTSISKLYSSIVPSSSRKSYAPSYSSYKKTPTPFTFGFKGLKLPKQTFGRFPVMVRRFGRWKTIGFGSTPKQALLIGKGYSQKTLGRSFYVPGIKQPKKIIGFRTKKEKGKQIFIEKTGKGLISTLGSQGEKQEIKRFRQMKQNFKPIKIKKKRKGRFDLW